MKNPPTTKAILRDIASVATDLISALDESEWKDTVNRAERVRWWAERKLRAVEAKEEADPT